MTPPTNIHYIRHAMKDYKLLLYFLLLFLYSKWVFSNQYNLERFWVFDKMSRVDLFGISDSILTSKLAEMYGQVEISRRGKNLTVKNYFLSNPVVCSYEDSNIEKTSLSYFSSEKTSALYERLFNSQNVKLSKIIRIHSAMDPDKTCPLPYDEFVESDGYLVFLDQDYAFFLKEVTENKKESVPIGPFSKHCHYNVRVQAFDGGEEYLCEFVDKDLQQVYLILKNYLYERVPLKQSLPSGDLEYNTNGGGINYRWFSKDSLQISIKKESEAISLFIIKKQPVTILRITFDSSY